MLSPRVRSGLLVGGLVSSATAGVLLGFGLRAGEPLRRFRVTAMVFLGERADLAGPADRVATIFGLLVHVGWTLLVGLAFTMAFARLRGAALALAAAGTGALVLLVQRRFVPWIGGSGSVAPQSLAQAILLSAALSVALVIGMRLAPPMEGER